MLVKDFRFVSIAAQVLAFCFASQLSAQPTNRVAKSPTIPELSDAQPNGVSNFFPQINNGQSADSQPIHFVAWATEIDTHEFPNSTAVVDSFGDAATAVITTDYYDGKLSIRSQFSIQPNNLNSDGLSHRMCVEHISKKQLGQVISDDFNNDGRKDLAVARFFDVSITILLQEATPAQLTDNAENNCSGFAIHNTESLPLPNVLASGDLNGDDFPDLAVGGNSHNICVLINLGIDSEGNWQGFAGPTFIHTPLNNMPFPSAIAIADFDFDGKNDVIVGTTHLIEGAHIFWNDGLLELNDNFVWLGTQRAHLASENRPSDIKIHDFNKDGIDDILISFFDLPGKNYICLGNEHSRKLVPIDLSIDPNQTVHKMALGDFNRDSLVDLSYLVHSDTTKLVVIPGIENAPYFDLNLSVGYEFDAAGNTDIDAGDVTGNGQLDLVVTNIAEKTIHILENCFDCDKSR